MGYSKIFEHKKVGHFEKKARDQVENEKRTENEYVRFWDISGKMHMPSRAKYILNILFGAFQVTPRTTYTDWVTRDRMSTERISYQINVNFLFNILSRVTQSVYDICHEINNISFSHLSNCTIFWKLTKWTWRWRMTSNKFSNFCKIMKARKWEISTLPTHQKSATLWHHESSSKSRVSTRSKENFQNFVLLRYSRCPRKFSTFVW